MKNFEVLYRLEGETFTKRVAGNFRNMMEVRAFCRERSNFPAKTVGYMVFHNGVPRHDTRTDGFMGGVWK